MLSSAVIGVPARWNGSIRTADIDAAFATIREKGGAVLQGRDPIPGGSVLCQRRRSGGQSVRPRRSAPGSVPEGR